MKGRQRYSYTLSLTSALDGVACQRHVPAALPPGEETKRTAVRALGPILMGMGSEPRTLQTIASRHTD
jgi:hypothetical protein